MILCPIKFEQRLQQLMQRLREQGVTGMGFSFEPHCSSMTAVEDAAAALELYLNGDARAVELDENDCEIELGA